MGALASITEAVAIHRELAGDNAVAFLPDLAMSLNNLSVDLGELGRREEGLAAVEEAVGAYRKLARVRPDAHPAATARVASSTDHTSGSVVNTAAAGGS